MRSQALAIADLFRRDLKTIDVGSGTGFTTEGIVQKIDPGNVTCIDQSPHQMARAMRKPALRSCRFQLGDAENLPVPTDAFDRYISAGSIEYWPAPRRGIAEAYRVLKPGGKALLIGPLRPENKISRFLADAWMLFPGEQEYLKWFETAGFTSIQTRYVAPHWVMKEKYAIAIVGEKPTAGDSPLALSDTGKEKLHEEMIFSRKLIFSMRMIAGNLAGFLFIPMAILAILLKPVRKRFYRKSLRKNALQTDPLTWQQVASIAFLVIAGILTILWLSVY